jgi:phospholipase C
MTSIVLLSPLSLAPIPTLTASRRRPGTKTALGPNALVASVVIHAATPADRSTGAPARVDAADRQRVLVDEESELVGALERDYGAVRGDLAVVAGIDGRSSSAGLRLRRSPTGSTRGNRRRRRVPRTASAEPTPQRPLQGHWLQRGGAKSDAECVVQSHSWILETAPVTSAHLNIITDGTALSPYVRGLNTTMRGRKTNIADPTNPIDEEPMSDPNKPGQPDGPPNPRDRRVAVRRRRFLTGVAADDRRAGARKGVLAAKEPKESKLPPPQASGVEHIVVLMMENRSFDHYLGWMPDADGEQAGFRTATATASSRTRIRSPPSFQGCGKSDPDHSYAGGRVEYNNGQCDGWLVAGDNDLFSIGYYTKADLAFYGQAAPQWTRPATAGSRRSWPRRIRTASTSTLRRPIGSTTRSRSRRCRRSGTVLAEKGVRGRYYFSDVPLLALWGSKLHPDRPSFSQFLADCANDDLPEVSFVEPRFLVEATEPPATIIRSPISATARAFVDLVYKAVTNSRAWKNTVLVVNYDEWGGFFDHVPPPTAPIPPPTPSPATGTARLGFRVPALLFSPFARRGYVSNMQFDHTSILNMIEWRWNLKPLTVRDETANNLAEALDFKLKKPPAPPQFSVPPGPFGRPCGTSSSLKASEAQGSASSDWVILQQKARSYGWPV